MLCWDVIWQSSPCLSLPHYYCLHKLISKVVHSTPTHSTQYTHTQHTAHPHTAHSTPIHSTQHTVHPHHSTQLTHTHGTQPQHTFTYHPLTTCVDTREMYLEQAVGKHQSAEKKQGLYHIREILCGKLIIKPQCYTLTRHFQCVTIITGPSNSAGCNPDTVFQSWV